MRGICQGPEVSASQHRHSDIRNSPVHKKAVKKKSKVPLKNKPFHKNP